MSPLNRAHRPTYTPAGSCGFDFDRPGLRASLRPGGAVNSNAGPLNAGKFITHRPHFTSPGTVPIRHITRSPCLTPPPHFTHTSPSRTHTIFVHPPAAMTLYLHVKETAYL